MKRNSIRRLYQDTGYHKEFLGLILLIMITIIVEMITIPYITKKMLNDYIPEKNQKGLIVFGVFYSMILILQCYMVLKHCKTRCLLQRKIQRDLREKVFQKLQEVQMKFYDENTTGTILQFLQEDVNIAGQLFPKIIIEMVFMGFMRFSIIALFLMFIDINITIKIVLLYLIGFFLALFFNRKTLNQIREIRNINIEIYTHINEGIKGFLTIKTLNLIQKKEEELERKLEEYTKLNKNLQKTITSYHTLFSFLTSFSTVFIVYYGGLNVLNGLGLYAEIMLFIDYNKSLQDEFNWLIKHLNHFHKSVVSYSKILEFIHLDKIEELHKGIELKKIETIEFKNVTFSYDREKNIQNFSLKIEEKDKVALVGKTGSGKTTITNLLCRFYEPNGGKILINGRDYKDYTIASIRKKIGISMQETQILPNTIIDNIKYANPNISFQTIEDIFKRLKLHEKILTLKDGYNTNIYDNPDILSMGEKQLIHFARMMAICPDVIILDEVTSMLSYESEELVKNAIKEISKDKIVIMIAHRLTTIQSYPHIVVMKNGRIEEKGNHKTLLEKRGMYAQLVNRR